MLPATKLNLYKTEQSVSKALNYCVDIETVKRMQNIMHLSMITNGVKVLTSCSISSIAQSSDKTDTYFQQNHEAN